MAGNKVLNDATPPDGIWMRGQWMPVPGRGKVPSRPSVAAWGGG